MWLRLVWNWIMILFFSIKYLHNFSAKSSKPIVSIDTALTTLFTSQIQRIPFCLHKTHFSFHSDRLKRAEKNDRHSIKSKHWMKWDMDQVIQCEIKTTHEIKLFLGYKFISIDMCTTIRRTRCEKPRLNNSNIYTNYSWLFSLAFFFCYFVK